MSNEAGVAQARPRWQQLRVRTTKNCCCAIAVPIAPAVGFRENELLPYVRLAQSIAFFNPLGIERFYSGVTKSTA